MGAMTGPADKIPSLTTVFINRKYRDKQHCMTNQYANILLLPKHTETNIKKCMSKNIIKKDDD